MSEAQKSLVEAAVGTSVGSVSVSAVLTLRVNLAVQHMLAAARFSREVQAIETQYANSEFGQFWEDMFHRAIASVMLSVASLEAYANEIFADREKLFPAHDANLLEYLWETYEQKPILEKFKFALILLNKPAIDAGARPFQDVKVLIDLRNALTHFKPEWSNETGSHERISSKLENYINGGLWMQSDPMFPRRWAGHNCTKWAVESVLDFAREFERISGFAPKYVVSDTSGLVA